MRVLAPMSLLRICAVFGGVCLAVLSLVAPAVATSATRPLAASGPVSAATAAQIVSGYGITGISGQQPTSVAQVRAAAAGAEVSVVGLVVDGRARAYLQIAPAHHAAAGLPTVVVLGGTNEPTTSEALRDQLYREAVAGQAVVVYPAPYLGSWSVGVAGCCGAWADDGQDDQAFVSAVLSDALARTGADPARTALVGYSGGGKLGYQLACAQPGRFASYSAVAAVPVTACTLPRGLAVQIVVGDQDPELPISGQALPATEALDEAVAVVRSTENCSSAAGSKQVGVATVTTWTCGAGRPVQAVSVSGLGHNWPIGTAPAADADSGYALVSSFMLGVRSAA